MAIMVNAIKNIIASIIVALCHILPATHGIDVSHRQGDIDWIKVSKDSNDIEFVYVKATEGATYFDPKFEDNVKGAHDAGMHVGAYHFFRMTSTPAEQFKSFNKCLKRCDKYIDILPVIDVETFDGKTSVQVKDSLDKFVKLVHDEYGIYPIIYGPDIAPARMMSKQVCDSCMFFIGQTESTEPRQKYDIWQYTCRAHVDGISTNVDMEKMHRNKCVNHILWDKDVKIRP